jgi:tetratricopeptide (TPR) repeat protein
LCIVASLVFGSLVGPAHAQQDSSSSSSDQGATVTNETKSPSARIAQPQVGASAITLETSEPLFYIAAGLNACGYDDDLAASSPVRLKIRDEINQELTVSAQARDSRDALCTYIRRHSLSDGGLNLAQYISLALYLSPPPELEPTVSQLDMPPDATPVVNILPLLRAFADDVHLNALWVNHHSDYDALISRLHDPLTQMVLTTNAYLGLPVSSFYDGRRFLVLLEPMLAPSATNARIYGDDYIVVVSPAGSPLGQVHMNDIRHTYLHFEIEPLVYTRSQAIDRLAPLLKPVQDAPLDFIYKANIAALTTECLIKAVEAHTMDVGLVKPTRPVGTKQRADLERFDAETSLYNRQAEEVRRKLVDLDMHQGWILTSYFYGQLTAMEKDSISLKDYIGEMVYGMDVGREQHSARQIVFLPEGSHEIASRGAPRQLTGIQLGEMKMLKGDVDGATAIAKAALADPNGDHAQAQYLMARLDLMQSQPGAAIEAFQATLKSSKDPRTLAWSHIYLGRLYDVLTDRQKALAEYQAALTVRDSQPDTKAAAENGLKEPFIAPGAKQETSDQPDENAPLDPSGKAEKDAYRPPPSK